ncbi:MAG: gliding motility-associated C-terminal domain-containing protein [Bacteroidota bacterium]
MQQLFTVLKYWLFLPILTTLVIVGSSEKTSATHAMGADLQYECLGGSTYRITLTIYRDCLGSALTPTQNIGFQSDSCGIPRFIMQANRTSITELSPLCPAQQPLSTCNNGILPGVEQHVYEMIYTFPSQCPDWQISWHLCCRNLAITNSVITNNTRIYIEAFLDNKNILCNNSPFFTTPPVPYLCDGQPFSFNNGAVDPDGDSLGFELINPLDFLAIQGQTTPVPYDAGFSPSYPMATNPPQSFNFDQNSGQISFTPSGLQQGIVALLVTEYRNGVAIGSTMRDLQMIVINCLNQPPVIAPPTNVTGGQFNGNTFSVCAGNTLTFDIGGSDPDPDLLTITDNLPFSVPGATLNTNGSNPWTGNFSWPTSLSDTGSYYFVIQAEDDGCPIQSGTSVGYHIVVETGEILPPQEVLICPNTDSILTLNSNIQTGPGGTFSWSPTTGLSDSTTGTVVATLGNDPITYTVTYSEPGECDVIEQIFIIPDIVLELDADSLSLCQGDTIQLGANVSFNGPQVPVTYLWAPAGSLSATNVPDPLAFPTTSTDFTVLVQSLSCAYVDTVHVEVDQAPTLASIPIQNICTGDSAQLFGSGTNLGSSTYSWSPILGLDDPSSLTPIASPTSSTVYSLIATNSCGADTSDVPVGVAPPLSISLSTEDLDCFGDNSGVITAVPFGGGANPVFSWTPNVGSGPVINNLAAGTYSVSVVDASGCMDTVTTTLVEPPLLSVNIDTVININCFGSFLGGISVSASGGTPGYEYSLDATNFFTISDFTNLPAGIYTVTARDANGCLTSLPGVQISQPIQPIIGTIDSLVNTNCNNNLGAIYASGTGGTPGYMFSLNGAAFQTNGDFTGLQPGYYQVLIADTLGCMDTVVAEIIEVADPFLLLDSIGNISCFGGSDGFIEVSPVSGTQPYLFQLDGGAFVPDSLFTGLSAGPHEVSLADANGCRYGLNVFLTEPDSLFGLVGNQTEVQCNGSNEGSVMVLASGGVGGYTFSLDPAGPFGVNNSFTGLLAGTYTVHIRDLNQCPAEVPVTISEPDPIQGILLNQEDVSCFGLSDGSFIIEGTGGTPDYQYSFEDFPFVDSGAFVNLPAGTYKIVIRDDRGCEDSTDVTINEPLPVGIDITDLVNVDCYEAASGMIQVAGTGGTAPYEFAFDSLTYSPISSISGLREGSYVILVRDANGCMSQIEADITQPEELLGQVINQPITCFGDDDGSASASAMGGVTPYSYSWSNGSSSSSVNNLGPGNHLVVVTDNNGCELAMSTEIIEPPEMVLDSTNSMDVTCYGGTDGMALAFASGGLPPYTFSWSNGASDSIVQGLAAGMYEVSIQDTNGCTIEEPFLIQQPDSIEIEIVEIGPAFCGLPTGFATVEASGGIPEYQYSWIIEPPQEGPTAVDLLGGNDAPPYTVLVSDQNGCTNSRTISVGVIGEPEAGFYPDFAPLDSVLWREETFSFINVSKNATAYLWDFGDGGLSNAEHPDHTYRDTGYYEVRLIAFDPNFACPDTATLGFRLLPPGAIYVPNAFTPNGDGTNDFFHPVGIGVEEVEMNIYSRWGLHITTLYSMDEKWNGYLAKGGAAPEGVYVWVIRAVINDGTVYEAVGTVTLFR